MYVSIYFKLTAPLSSPAFPSPSPGPRTGPSQRYTLQNSIHPKHLGFLSLLSSSSSYSLHTSRSNLWVQVHEPYIRHSTYIYVVWQKSNETDFLLTTNFIPFTNEGYHLQNSSLGQLLSDGGVVSIVPSSAGRVLLVYLTARRLRSSGYYPKYKMAPFQLVFEPGK